MKTSQSYMRFRSARRKEGILIPLIQQGMPPSPRALPGIG